MEYLELNNQNPIDIKLSIDSPYSSPVFKETTNKKWIAFVDNDKKQYPERLIYYKNNCALHGSILRSIVRQYTGNGFIVDETLPKASATEKFLENINNEENANEVLSKVASDLKSFGGISLIVVWSKDYKKIVSVEHIDFAKLRAGLVDPSTGKVPGYFYSWNWNTQRPEVAFIPTFSEASAKEQSKQYDKIKKQLDETGDNIEEMEKFFMEPTSQILYWFPYESGSFYYPYPDYVAGINAIRTLILTDQYGVNSMENGLTIDFVVNFMGAYDDAAKKKEAQAFLKQFTNPAKKKMPLITFSQDKEHQMEITNISGIKEDNNYTKINANAVSEVLASHGITSRLLVGLEVAGSLGGKNELADAELLFFKNVIRPGQLQILKVFNRIMKINGLEIIDIDRLTIYNETPNNEIIEPEASTNSNKQ